MTILVEIDTENGIAYIGGPHDGMKVPLRHYPSEASWSVPMLDTEERFQRDCRGYALVLTEDGEGSCIPRFIWTEMKSRPVES